MESGKKDLRKLIESNRRDREREYWLQQFESDPERVSFPFDIIGTQDSEFRRQTLEFEIEGDLFNRIIRVGGQSDHALFIILMTVLVVLVYKYTEQDDITIGIPILEQAVEAEFINTVLPLRIHLNDHLTFKRILGILSETFIGANENQNYPIESLLYQMKMEYSRGEPFPLFDIAILMKNLHRRSYLRDIRVNMLFSFDRRENSIVGNLEYNLAVYHATTMREIADRYIHLLKETLFRENIQLREFELISLEERQRLLADFNATQADFPDHLTLHRLFEEQVERTPDYVSVIFGNHRVSYLQLNSRINQLSHFLISKGVVPNTVVALMLERSIELLMSILAVLKAGGAYLPIDIAYPRERIAYMIEDSSVTLLLTQKHLSTPVECEEKIDLSSSSLYLGCDKNPQSPSRATDLVYTIYTSGSTGRPKGVLLEHRGIVNMLVNRRELYRMSPDDTALQLFSYAFDGYVTSFFTPIISGSGVVLLSEAGVKDIAAIKEVIVKARVTHLLSIPQLFQGIIENLTLLEAASLKIVTLAGDKVSPRLLEIVRQKNRGLEIAVEYGVTEVSVMSTILRHQEKEARLTIGGPIANTSIYIMNKYGQAQPAGIAGEMCIGGVGLARGYLNNPVLTSQKFLENPCYPGERIYKTGDLAKWRLPERDIEFQGRIDLQVKVRGFRIELQEVENQLLGLSSIKDALVIAREDGRGNSVLCAYYVAGEMIPVIQLREFLTKRLPDYMIPSYFLHLERFPLSHNGKLDRKRLPLPEIHVDDHYAEPRDKTEESLVRIWSKVLTVGFDKIGIDANFFEIGGHSLNTINLISEIHKELNVKLSINDIFELPTVRRMAEFIQGMKKDIYQSIHPGEKREYYLLSSAQHRLWASHQMDPLGISYNLPQVIMMEEISGEKMKAVFLRLIERHENLRTSFQVIHDQPSQRIHAHVDFSIESYNLPDHDSPKQIIQNFVRSFDISAAPLFRLGIIYGENRQNYVLFDMHHILTDAVSSRILALDFLSFYEGRALPPLKLQYRDYSQWQHTRETKQAMRAKADFWKTQFKEDVPDKYLPIDYPRPDVKTYAGDTIEFSLSAEEVVQIKEWVRQSEMTMFIWLLAILNVLLAGISHRTDIVVGTVVAGRRHADLERIMGFFVNILALRNFPDGVKKFSDFLTEVKARTLAAFDNQDYPFEELVEMLGLDQRKQNPLFDVVLTLQKLDLQYERELNQRNKDLASEFRYTNPTSKFDLVLGCVEGSESLEFTFEYSTQLFKRETILRMTQYFRDIVKAVLQNKDVKLNEITLSHHLVDIEANDFHQELREFEI